MTVNEEFKQTLQHSFTSSLEEALSMDCASSSISVKEKQSLTDINEAEFFVLTMSSQLFRIFILLHFTKSPQTEQFVTDTLKINANNMEADKFYDYLGEVGNAFCGSIKREIGKIVPSLGMSTPNRLGKECLKYIDLLHTDFESHAVADYDESPLFYASIYLCADEELNLDVSASQSNKNEVESGELDFF